MSTDTADSIARAEQRGREDNADHGMCYVSGSRALALKRAEAWAEGWTAGWNDAINRHDPVGETPNPYDLPAGTAS